MAAADPGLSDARTLALPDAALTTPQGDLLLHLARQWPVAMAQVVLSALVIAAVLSLTAPAMWVAGWLGMLVAVTLLCSVARSALIRADAATETRRLQWAIGLTLAMGATQGAVVGFFPWLDALAAMLVSVVVMVLAAGFVSSSLGHRPLAFAHLVPSLAPLALAWALQAPALGGAASLWLGPMVAVLIVLFALALLVLGRRAWHRHEQIVSEGNEQQRLARQLGAGLQRAEAASRAKTSFLAAASHDLRQPMHTLSLFGAALLMRPLDDRTREIALHMDGALRVLGSQLDALLDVSRLDAGVVDAELLHFPLGSFVQRLCRDVQPAAAARGLDLVVAVDSDHAVRSDPMLLERVLRNLLDNAIKYTEHGRITVALRSGAGRFTLTVADTGRGIPMAEQRRVFEEFYQLDNPGRDRSQGLGLGLSIVRRLVDLLGIELALASTPGRGTTVTLRLPVAEPLTATRIAPPPAPSAAALHGRHVLVIDDEDAVRTGMRALLEAHGCLVSLAATRPAALAAADASPPDIVLADLRLRDNDTGIDCVLALRALQPGLPALLISGDTSPEHLRLAHTAGLRLLHKPVDIDLLRAAMLQALDA